MKSLKWLVGFALLFASGHASSAELEDGGKEGTFVRYSPVSKCNEILTQNTRVVLSGRESDKEVKEIGAAIKELLDDGGLFDRLGIARPYQTIRFVPGGDLNIIGSLNNISVAHWKDGQAVVNASRRGGLLYELVIPGKNEMHSFYRDDNSFSEQLSILFHALAGHVHVARYSRYQHDMHSDPVAEAYALSEFMDDLRKKISGDAVSRWYQYLLSLDYAQDLLNANYQAPEDLKVSEPNLADPKTLKRFQPTANVLQAFVANLPAEMPLWQKDMARRVERLRRYIPGAIKTKILHEGYSTLMQEILPGLTKYNSLEEGIRYCCLLNGVAAPSLSNPYWIGLEAWRNIYSKFMKRAEIAALPTLEGRIKEFIAYAKTEIIGKMDDEDLMRFGLDASWVTKNGFALVRPYKENEYNPWDGKLKSPGDPKRPWPYSILSRDPQKVIESIIHQNKHTIRLQLPRVEQIAESDDQGHVAHEISDGVGREIGLDAVSAVETLYVWSQIRRRPNSLEATFDVISEEGPDEHGFPRWSGGFDHRPKKTVRTPTRMKVSVTPRGEVRVQVVKRSGSSLPSSLPMSRVFFDPEKHTPTYEDAPEISKMLTEALNHFVVNLDVEKYAEVVDPKTVLKAMQSAVSAVGLSPSLGMAVPTTSRAIMEYNNFVGRRLAASLKLAIHGKGKILRGQQGVKVAALPKIPYFNFDRQSVQSYLNNAPAMPLPMQSLMAGGLRGFASHEFMRPEDSADVHKIPGSPGDVVWGPKPKGGGSGEGEGEDGDPQKEASEEGGEVLFEDVSLDDYAQALMDEDITLPNLRPKAGPTQKTTDEFKGKRIQQTGTAVRREILRNAYRRGLPSPNEIEENPELLMDAVGIIKRGLGRLRLERDWVVKNIETKPDPDINALVVLTMDMSGSMEFYKKAVKSALYDLRALLLRKYKNVKVIGVTFNEHATVFTDMEEFFRFQPNGGTRYAHGWKKVIEVYDEGHEGHEGGYPEGAWDRFAITAGDMIEGFDSYERDMFDEMKSKSQFTATLAIGDSADPVSELEKYLIEQADQDEFVGFSKIAPPDSYTPLIFKELFKNPSSKN